VLLIRRERDTVPAVPPKIGIRLDSIGAVPIRFSCRFLGEGGHAILRSLVLRADASFPLSRSGRVVAGRSAMGGSAVAETVSVITDAGNKRAPDVALHFEQMRSVFEL